MNFRSMAVSPQIDNPTDKPIDNPIHNMSDLAADVHAWQSDPVRAHRNSVLKSEAGLARSLKGGAEQFAQLGRRNLSIHNGDSGAQRKSRLSAPTTTPGPTEAGTAALRRLNVDPDHQRRAHNGQKSYLSKERERARRSIGEGDQ